MTSTRHQRGQAAVPEGIYPKTPEPSIHEVRMTEGMAMLRARRWEVRYDEAMDMVEMWQQRYVQVKKELDELRTELEKESDYKPKHRAEPAHPDTMIGGGGARRRPSG